MVDDVNGPRRWQLKAVYLFGTNNGCEILTNER